MRVRPSKLSQKVILGKTMIVLPLRTFNIFPKYPSFPKCIISNQP